MYVTRFTCPACGNTVQNRLYVKVKIESWCTRRDRHPKPVRMVEEPLIPPDESLTTKSKTKT